MLSLRLLSSKLDVEIRVFAKIFPCPFCPPHGKLELLTFRSPDHRMLAKVKHSWERVGSYQIQ